VPIIPIFKIFAPSVNTPPSPKIRHCRMRTIIIIIRPAKGPKIIPKRTPPKKCPDVPYIIGKLTICDENIKAPKTPINGIVLSFNFSLTLLIPIVRKLIEIIHVDKMVFVSR